MTYGVVCVILRLAVLAQYQACDRRTDGQTDGEYLLCRPSTQDDSMYRASIAWRGKNGC